MVMSQDTAELAALADFVAQHPRLFVLGGAGCSTDSGIPDYRDVDGEWKRPSPVTFQAFTSDEFTRKRYWARSLVGWPTMAHARPGAAHRALAELESLGHVELLLTQNVDGLHEAAGSRNTVDLHGRIDTVRCLGCEARTPRAALQIELRRRNPLFAELEAGVAPDGDADLEGRDFGSFDVPDCPVCGGMLKPDVVFFGESVPRDRVAAANEALDAADAVLVVGSSLMVYSGFRFVQAAAKVAKPRRGESGTHARGRPVHAEGRATGRRNARRTGRATESLISDSSDNSGRDRVDAGAIPMAMLRDRRHEIGSDL